MNKVIEFTSKKNNFLGEGSQVCEVFADDFFESLTIYFSKSQNEYHTGDKNPYFDIIYLLDFNENITFYEKWAHDGFMSELYNIADSDSVCEF